MMQTMETGARLSPSRLSQFQTLLQRCGLADEGDADYFVLLFDAQDTLVACGALARNVLKQIAVAPEAEGEGAAAAVVTALLQETVLCGYRQAFLFTKPEKRKQFCSLGFSPVANTDSICMLELPARGIDSFLTALPKFAGDNGCIVLNGNPLTNGHLRLIRHAASRCAHLYLFVLREENALFDAATRLRFAQENTRDLPNVSVHSSDSYLVSRATFPAYFLKSERKIAAKDDLDLALFTQRIAPALSIRTRFVGSEPFDPATAAYNRRMMALLPPAGIAVEELPRTDGVSASAVRNLLKAGRVQDVAPLVPPSVYAYCIDHFS